MVGFSISYQQRIMEAANKIRSRGKQAKNIDAHALSNIAEITEEDQTVDHRNIIMNDAKDQQTDKVLSVWARGINCARFMWQSLFCCRPTGDQFKIEQSQISEIINKLRRRKASTQSLLPPRDPKWKKTLVLDLDETLLFTNFRRPSKYDFQIEVQTKGATITGYVTKRFGLEAFLFQMAQIYEIVVFSSSKRTYVDQVLSKIDPKKWISYSLTREHCTVINQSYFIKPIKNLGRDISSIVIVDDNRMSASLNPQNLYKIDPFRGNMKDRSLIQLSHFLKNIQDEQQILPLELLRRKYESKQIKISTEPEKKIPHRGYHLKRNSQLSNLVENAEETSVGMMAMSKSETA